MLDNRPLAVRLRPDEPDDYTLMLECRLAALGAATHVQKSEINRLRKKMQKLLPRLDSPRPTPWQRIKAWFTRR